MNGSMNLIKVHSPVSEIGTYSLALNHDMGFAGGIISKYSMTGQYFFQGTALTFLEMNRNNEESGTVDNSVYLSLKLLIAYNYQQLNENFTTNQEAYVRNISLMLQNYMNQLKLTDQKGYEYINRVYQLVGTKIEYRERERLQELLEEELKHLTSGSDNQTVLTKEQTDIVKQLAQVNIKQPKTALSARDDNSDRRSALPERHQSSTSDMKHHTGPGNIQIPDMQADIRKQNNNNIQGNTENEDNNSSRNNRRDSNSNNNSNYNNQNNINNQGYDFNRGSSINRNNNYNQDNINKQESTYNLINNYNQDNTNRDNIYNQDSTHNQDNTYNPDNIHNPNNTNNQDNPDQDNNNPDSTFQQESTYDLNSNQESTYNQNRNQDSTYNRNNRSNLIYADNQVNTGIGINNAYQNDNNDQADINHEMSTVGQAGIENPDNAGGQESSGSQFNSSNQDVNYNANTSVNANDLSFVAANQEENTDSESSVEHQIDELDQLFQDIDFETSIRLKNDSNFSMKEQAIPAYESVFQYDNDDIPVNIFRKDSKALSQQERMLLNEIMTQLQIKEENRQELLQDMEHRDIHSIGYTELLHQFKTALSNRKIAKLFLEELQQKNIKTEDIFRLFTNMKDSYSMVLHRDELAKLIADKSIKVQKEVLQTIWKQTGDQPDKIKKENPADWIKAASKEEIQKFITKVEESNSKIYEELLHKKILEVKPDKGINPDTVKKLPEKTIKRSPESDINNAYEQTAVRQSNAYRANLSNTDQADLSNTEGSDITGIAQELDQVSGKRIGRSLRFINSGAFDINHRKEKLIALITERRYGSLSNVSEFFVPEDNAAAQRIGIPAEISYENSIAANELVYIIRNADENKLRKIEQFILSNPLFRNRITADQIPPAAKADISRGLSSIRSYQDSLTGQNSLNSVKNLLINTVMESTQKAVIRVSELVKSVFDANELTDMLKEIPDKKASRGPDILSRDVLIYLIRHADGVRFENLLHTFLAEGAVNNRIIDELAIKEIVKYSSQEGTQILSDTPQLPKDKFNISSIRRNRHRQSIKKQENFLKDELIKLIVQGKKSGQEDIIQLMKAEFPEVEQEIAADRSNDQLDNIDWLDNINQPDNIDRPDNINRSDNINQTDIIGLEDRTKKPEDNYEPMLISQGDLTRKLVYFIRKADRGELQRIVEHMRLHPSFAQRINLILNRTGIEQQAISEETADRQKPFESSIIRNKFLLEHRRSLYEHTIKQQINELLDHGTVTEQQNLISMMTENQELLQKAKNKVDNPLEVIFNNETGRRYIKQIFEKADPQELQEFVRIYNSNAVKRSSVEHPEEGNQAEEVWDQVSQEELSRELYQGEVPRLKVSQTEVNQKLINQKEVNQSKVNQSKINQGNVNRTISNQIELLNVKPNQPKLNQTKVNQDNGNQDEVSQGMVSQAMVSQAMVNQNVINQNKGNLFEILQTGSLQTENSYPELQAEDIILADSLVFRDGLSDHLLQAVSDNRGIIQQSENRQAFSQQSMFLQGLSQQGMLQQGLLQQEMQKQEILQQDISQQNISQQDLLQQPENILRQIRHSEILEQNILLQKTILEEVFKKDSDGKSGITNQLQQDGSQIFSLKQNLGRASRAREEEVIKKVKEYIVSEQSEMNYQNNRNTQTSNELKAQKKEISQLKENLQQQNKAVEELKKLIARDKSLPDKMDVNQISRDIMKKIQHELTMARLRNGFD